MLLAQRAAFAHELWHLDAAKGDPAHETDWHSGASAKIGLEFGRPAPERRGLTVLLEAYDGFSPFGQFLRNQVNYYGAGLQFDF